MSLKIGELFAGYGGLGMGVQAALGGELAWYSEIDKGALKILEHRFPDVPNIGDITTVDWSQIEPVDILTGGSPCQDLSHAGKRAGMTEGTRSNLWVAMREAIAQLRPKLVIWENVRGAYSAAADSEVEPCAGCVGDGPGVHLRALGRVLGDLSDLGYVGGWHGLRAADVGAPHGRFRVFVVAYADSEGCSRIRRINPVRRDTDGCRRTNGHGQATQPAPLFRTPTSQLAINGGSQHPEKRKAGGHGPTLADEVEHLLPTPAVNDMGEGKTVERWDEWTADMQAKHGNGNGHGKSLAIEAQRLLPTPMVGSTSPAAHGQISGQWRDQMAEAMTRWGDYAAAIARWENVLGQPAPAPTQASVKGNPQLSPAFVEWLMGLPAGWVTDVPGITRNEALRALGNGVVPQQAEAAIRWIIERQEAAA